VDATTHPATALPTAARGRGAPQVSQLPTATPAGAPGVEQRITVALTVVVLQSSKAVISVKDPPGTLKPLGGVRVQLVNAFGDVLTEALTPPSGQVTLTRDIMAGSGVFVRLLALGTQIALDPTTTTLTIKVPAGGNP
jgi:hypothetical protein